MKRLFRLPIRRSPAGEVEEEFAFHLERRAEELIEQAGLPTRPAPKHAGSSVMWRQPAPIAVRGTNTGGSATCVPNC